MFSDIETESVINMRKRTVRLEREGGYWTDEEKAILVQKFGAGEGITAIALELHRSEPAVCQMIEKLDLYNRKTQPVRKKSPPEAPCLLVRKLSAGPRIMSTLLLCHGESGGGLSV